MYEITDSPKFYHYRNKNESDKDWILSRMCRIPPAHQSQVAREYEAKYLAGTRATGRRAANTYLQAVAKEFYEQDNIKKTQET